MKTYASVVASLGAAASLAVMALPADAVARHHSAKGHVAKHHRHHIAKHQHSYVAFFRQGYTRRGPEYGYRFGFATYAGDPFYSDDYYDGRGCYYLHRHDFCRGPKSLDWLRFH